MPHEGEPSGGRSWWHVLGKCLLVAALLAGAVPPLLLWLLLLIPPLLKDGPRVLLYGPMFTLPLVAAFVVILAVIYEVRFARLLVVASCVFMFVGPMSQFEGGGPLHGGELIFGLHALGGLLACLVAVPGLLLWRRKPAPPAAPDGPNPWSRPTAYPRAGHTGLR